MPKYENPPLRGNKLAFHAYIAPPDGARPGIIYRAWNGESPPQDLLRELRRANPPPANSLSKGHGAYLTLSAHSFHGRGASPSVKMFGILYAVFNFRPKVEACLNCRQVGHRRDVCPLPNRLTCPSCGQKHPGRPPLHSAVRHLWGRSHDGRQSLQTTFPTWLQPSLSSTTEAATGATAARVPAREGVFPKHPRRKSGQQKQKSWTKPWQQRQKPWAKCVTESRPRHPIRKGELGRANLLLLWHALRF
ncbi:hypothetical protein MTO96_032194 [Rhipicephalus appendiculatus]